MRVFFISLLLLPLFSISQKISPPNLEFQFLKITSKSLKPFVNNKYGEKKYNQSILTFYNNEDGSPRQIKVDIPNYFYMKEGMLTTVDYKKSADGDVNYVIGYVDGKKLCFVSFHVIEGRWDSRVISVSFIEDFEKKLPPKHVGLLEYEISE